MKTTLTVLVVASLASCASLPGGGAYDPEAKETLGRIADRRDTGATTRQWHQSFFAIPVGALLVPIPLGPIGPVLPIFEHSISLEDGRNLSVYSTYPNHPVGGCVKIFESKRKDYPRLINFSGCKQ